MTSRELDEFALLLPGGGLSVRFKGGDKLLAVIAGLPVFLHAVRTLGSLFRPGAILMAVPESQIEIYRETAKRFLPETPVRFLAGGATRMESVCHLVRAASELDFVRRIAIHDAARPLTERDAVLRCADACRHCGGALLCRKITDTVKESDSGNSPGFAVHTLPRERLWAAETPQMFELADFRNALELAAASGKSFTDDAQIMETYGPSAPAIVPNEQPNPKITFQADLALCEALLLSRQKG